MSISTFIVDDAPVMVQMLKNIFSDSGIEVSGDSRSVNEGIEEIGSIMPKILLLDAEIEGEDVIESITKILAVSPETKIILCANSNLRDTLMTTLNSGAKDFILKPYKKLTVIRTVKNVMETA